MTSAKIRLLKIVLAAFVIYFLIAWLPGSAAVLFVDYDKGVEFFNSPFKAMLGVPTAGANGWWIAFSIIFSLFGYMIFVQARARFPEMFLQNKEVEFSKDPSCGTARWLTTEKAREILSFGEGPGILFGRLDGQLVRHDTPRLNRNIVVFGSPGSRKTRGLIIPNAMQAVISEESVIFTDPKGEILRFTLDYFRKNDYEVRVFNLVDTVHSDRWNPLSEIKTDLDAQLFSEIVIANTAVPGIRKIGGDPFWTRAEQNLLKALTLYVINEYPIEQRTLETLYSLVSGQSLDDLDATFTMLPATHPAKAPYNIFSQADKPVKTGVIIGFGTRLQVVQNQEIKNLTAFSDINLINPGQKKCAYFGIISDTDTTFDFLASLFFSFLFIQLTKFADSKGGPCPTKVNFLFDEFCNIGQIPDFKKRIATVRSRGLSCMLITQSVAQLKNRYPDDEWQEIISCCDSRLMFGANEPMTAEYMAKILGVGTVIKVGRRHAVSGIDAVNLNLMPSERSLMTPDEIMRLDRSQGLLCLAGYNPALITKVDLTEHPEGKDLPDGKGLRDVLYTPVHISAKGPPPITVTFPDEDESSKNGDDAFGLPPVQQIDESTEQNESPDEPELDEPAQLDEPIGPNEPTEQQDEPGQVQGVGALTNRFETPEAPETPEASENGEVEVDLSDLKNFKPDPNFDEKLLELDEFQKEQDDPLAKKYFEIPR